MWPVTRPSLARVPLRIAGAACLGLLLGAAAPVPEPSGFRMSDYRAPVPATVQGGTPVHPAALQALIASGHPVLVDVLPAPIRPPDARPDRPWLPVPHRDIPGSLWLPDVGRGALSPTLDSWFRRRLDAATGGDSARPVVFYCLSSCWMSWNATKRAASYGYTHALWLEEGADGWEAVGLPVSNAVPETPKP